MPFDVSAIIGVLPQFIIGGIVAMYFYSTFSKRNPNKDGMLDFTMVNKNGSRKSSKKDTADSQKVSLGDRIINRIISRAPSLSTSKYYRTGTKAKSDPDSIVPEIQLLVLTLSLWMLIFILISPITILAYLLPYLPFAYSNLIYVALAAVLGLALITTVLSRINLTKMILIVMIVAAGAVTLGAFYSPSMGWTIEFGKLMQLVIIYSAVAIACFSAYLVSVYMKRDTALSASKYTSFASYGLMTFILSYNLLVSLL